MFKGSSLVGPDPITGLLRRLDFEYKMYQLLLNAADYNPISLLHVSYDLETISVELKLRLRFDYDLQLIANAIKNRSQRDYVMGRIGRADIGVIASLNQDNAESYAQELCDGVKADFLERTKCTDKTVSIGVITVSSNIQVESVLHEAERSMIAAKAMGHSQVCTRQHLEEHAIRSGIPLNLLSMEYKIRVEAEKTASDVAFQTRRTILDYIHKAETDPLTGLNNRGYLDKRLSREIDNAHKHSIPLSIAILDADNFGRVNKDFDYPTGDATLRVIADVLRQETRTTDWVARYGGEEFCVVMLSTLLDDGIVILERIRQAISGRSIPTNKGEPLRVTVSIGAIELTQGELELDELYTRASDALQVAKNKGKNSIAYQDLALSDVIKIFGNN